MDQVTRTESIRRVEACLLKDIPFWLQANMLKQNADKTEVIVFTSICNAGLVKGISVTVGDSLLSFHHVSEIWVHGLIPGWIWSSM